MADVERWAQQLRKGSSRLVVLQLLTERDRYGYEIVAEIEARTGGRLRLPEGNVYPALHALEEEGAIASYWRSVDPAAPDRKYYRITREGRGLLAGLVQQWDEHTQAIGTLLNGAREK